MAAYTLDEKFKRNSSKILFPSRILSLAHTLSRAAPGRVIFSVAGFHICQRTPHGNSLVALLSIFHLVTGVLMGLTVGWGDGNAVDLEIAEEKARADKRAEKSKVVASKTH